MTARARTISCWHTMLTALMRLIVYNIFLFFLSFFSTPACTRAPELRNVDCKSARALAPVNIKVTLLLILLHAAAALIIAVVKREQRAVTKWLACVQRVLTEKTMAREGKKKNITTDGTNIQITAN